MNINMPILKQKLSDFGLNPSEWILETPRPIAGLFHFHVRNEDMLLEGWAGREHWLSLSYVGPTG